MLDSCSISQLCARVTSESSHLKAQAVQQSYMLHFSSFRYTFDWLNVLMRKLPLLFFLFSGREKQSTESQLLHVQQQISDLAYGNYRIYADAGSTTERCRTLVSFVNYVHHFSEADSF